jgi:hypothetical protein
VLEFSLDLVIGNLDGLNADRKSLVRRKIELGANIHLDCQNKFAAEVCVARPLDNVSFRTAERTQLVLGDSLAVETVKAIVNSVL